MTSSNFDNKVIIEQVRCVESLQVLSNDAETSAFASNTSHDFDGRLLLRARQLVRQHELEDTLSHAAGLWRLSAILAGTVAVLLGAMASLYAVAGDTTINIYWLLLVLVGFNLISIALWLFGISIGMDSLVSGALSRASAWLPATLGKPDTAVGHADRAWLKCHLGGAVGKWRLSQLNQQLWLLYLCSGLVTLVLVLMARQFDFVWGTTLLSDESFVQLTGALGQPLQALGFATPSTQQVIETRIGAGYALDADHRYSWAQFLIGALLVFGIAPRLLLWLLSRVMLGLAQGRFALDYYLPYYIRMRQQLLPLHGRSEIVDADTAPPAQDQGINAAQQPRAAMSRLPQEVHWVALELGDAVAWPLATVTAAYDLGEVVDRASLDNIVTAVQEDASANIAIVVSAGRPPDRGLKRMVSSLCAAAAGSWLVLLERSASQPIAEARLSAWYRLAQECGVPAENVIITAET